MPAKPKIYHIVHVDRLASIIADDCLWSDSIISRRAGPGTIIGMGGIKQRRLTLPVHCHLGDHVAEYVPFYFCPRSVMLYVIYRANHEELAYRGGQGPIVHLEADLHDVVTWANGANRRWAFALSNAATNYTQFCASLDDLDQINWAAVAATDWRASEVREGKQSEFLVYESFPWSLVSRIGVKLQQVYQQVHEALKASGHQPKIEINSDWYY